MTIHDHLDFEDILALQEDVIKHSYTHQIKKMYYKWILAVAIFLAILFLFGPSLTSAMVGAVMTVVFLLVFRKLYTKVTFSQAKSRMEKADYAHILGPSDIMLTETGIERHVNGDVTHFKWTEFTRFGKDETHFFLYQTDMNGLILSKHPNNLSADETNAYQKLIQSQAGGNN